jgi:DUF1680 family protein
MTETTLLRRFTPVPYTAVHLDDAFWAPRQQVNRKRTLFAQYRQLKETGSIDAFRLEWKPDQGPKPHFFWDSDVAKWVEAACDSLRTHPDAALAALVEEVVQLIISAQQPDGYLNVYFTVVEPGKRWTNLRDYHELYCAGHLMEAAVAHYQATGRRDFLNAMCRYADHIDAMFGPAEDGKRPGYCGHEEIELALVKLYHATGEARYLRLSQFMVEERGRQPYYFHQEAIARNENPELIGMDYFQSHLPVREQTEAVGHAVRAMYLYCAMADLAGELGDASLLAACERLWESVATRRMYLTGGIGSMRYGERFTHDYDLPNLTAYAETCAAVGMAFWNHRMLQFDGDGRYADILERALYNGVISGISHDGEQYFYENPLASTGGHHRQPWFGCACCPSNLSRLLVTLGQYVYSVAEGELAVHLYVQGKAEIAMPNGATLQVRQQTRYPWDGEVRLTVTPASPTPCTVRLRIPGWCRRYAIAVNGETINAPVEKGYACLHRVWQPGDTVTLALDMPVEVLESHPAVLMNGGRIALQRGPLVYCVEDVDQPVSVFRLAIPDDVQWATAELPEVLDGIVAIDGQALALDLAEWTDTLYRPVAPIIHERIPLRAIPYYAWDNREPGAMTVWLPRAASYTWR